MQVYLLRHGIAEEGKTGVNDALRSVTAEGRRKLRQVLKSAAEAGVRPELIISSPLKRALQTAELAKEILSYGDIVAQSKALSPGASAEEAWDEIRVHKDVACLLLVGHNPLFALLAAFLLGTPQAQIDFKKGAMMRVDLDKISLRPRGTLRWYVTPRLAAN